MKTKLLIGLLVIIVFIIGCAEETINIEWFQTGNIQDITKLQTKKSQELEDNRIGGLWDLVTPEYYGDPDEFFHDINNLGLKRIRVLFSFGDWPDVENTGVYSEYYIKPHQDKTITGLADNDIKIMCGLVFWDETIKIDAENKEEYSRFKTEDEIQGYLDHVKFIVQNFKDRIEYYEILNEPNIRFGEGTQQYVELDDYINLVKRVVPVIRGEYPEAKIVVGATAAFREENTKEYLFGILESDVMPLVDGISFHPLYGDASPQFDKEYYYNYPSLIQEIKETASAHGFKGEYIADELNYRTQRNPNIYEPWTYSDLVAAKYYARGIIINLGLDLTVGLCEMEPGNYDLAKMRMVRNTATVMAGAKPTDLPVEIESEAENIKSYTFSLSNGDKLIALWTDGIAVDEDPGVKADLTFADFSGKEVIGIDVLNGYTQSIVIDGDTVKDLIVRDYPLILKIH